MAASLDAPHEADAEDLYADAAAKTALYARLSRNAAGDGDAVLAVAAAWAADVHAVQALWWERARDAGGGPIEPFLAAGAAIGAAVDAEPAPDRAVPSGVKGAAGRDDPRTASGVVEAARRSMLAAFDPPAALLVAGRLAGVEHLAALPAPGYPTARPVAVAARTFAARLAGRPVPEMLAELQIVAADARLVARALAAAGFRRDAVGQLVLAETAVFEAYLLEVAVAVDDAGLLGADLRRAAFADVLPAPMLLPENLAAARELVRDAMRTVLGAGELARFAERLAAYDDGEIRLPQYEEPPPEVAEDAHDAAAAEEVPAVHEPDDADAAAAAADPDDTAADAGRHDTAASA